MTSALICMFQTQRVNQAAHEVWKAVFCSSRFGQKAGKMKPEQQIEESGLKVKTDKW